METSVRTFFERYESAFKAALQGDVDSLAVEGQEF